MDEQAAQRIDRLLDAIELVQAERKAEAKSILQSLIRENNDFEDAWLWMSLVVDGIDQSAVCLENVLRINPNNMRAASALYRLREQEYASERQRAKLRNRRDWATIGLWSLTLFLLYAVMATAFAMMAVE